MVRLTRLVSKGLQLKASSSLLSLTLRIFLSFYVRICPISEVTLRGTFFLMTKKTGEILETLGHHVKRKRSP